MTNTYLRVTFPKTDTLKYNNPKSWHCFDFKICSYWQPAKSISWVDIPYNKFAVFFETRNCRAEDKYVFTSSDGLTSGINKFLNPQPIRLMMIGKDHSHTRHPLVIHFLCPVVYETIAKSSCDEASNKTYEFESSSDNGSVAGGGLSSNCIPEASAPGVMPIHDLTAIFDGGTVNYSNPVTWTCLEFGSCFNRKLIKSVHWRLPANKYGVLYESDTCVAGGQFTYITDMNDLDATQKLKTARAFRSMMVRESVDSTLPPSVTYMNRCSSTSADKESSSVEISSVAVNESNINGNLSSNWYDVLPSTSLPLENGSSSFNDTATALND